MNHQDLQSDLFEDKSKQTTPIDIKRILYRAIKYWYMVALSLLVAVSIAFLFNRYATRVYPITASIIIKETQETQEGRVFGNNPLFTFYKNYLNELYIIKSHPLIGETIKDLSFEGTLYREGNFLTTDVYSLVPIKGRVLPNESKSGYMAYLKVLDSVKFELISAREENPKSVIAKFNDTINFEGRSMVFECTRALALSKFVGEQFIFLHRPAHVLADSYVARLNASWAEEGSGVVNLSISGSNSEKEIDFLNGLIARYQEYNLEKKSAAATRTIAFITEQLNGITDSLRTAERQLETFKNENVLTDLSAETLRLYQKIESVEQQKTELTIRHNYYQYLTDYIQNSANLDQVILPTSVGISDNILAGLLSKMVDLQVEMKLLLSREKMENPLVNERKRRIAEIKESVIESVRNQLGVDKIKRGYLDRELKTLERGLERLPSAERKLVSIKRNYTLLENLYVFLLQRRAEAGISKAATVTDIEVVNPPMSGSFISPQPLRNYLLAVFTGLSLPILIFILLELFNTRVQSREDIEKLTKIPFVGGVGHKKDDNNQVVLKAPKTAIAESFRALRSNLNYFIGNRDQGVFLITSSISGEGKTFSSVNLASVFALSGKKTLIIGADMRRPKIFADFELGNEVGLSSYLAGLSSFEAVVQKTKYENLDLASGGPVPPNPSELLLSGRMDEFIAEAKRHYSYIIIDTPPLGIVTDAFILTKYADHTLFIVRQDYTPKELLKNAEEFYSSGKLKNISLFLNDIFRSGPGYGYGYGYGYGAYGYGYYNNKNDYYTS